MSEGEPRLPDNIVKQIQLATELEKTSEILSVVFPAQKFRTWHVITPQFDDQSITLKGRSVSDQLSRLAKGTSELHVNHNFMEEDFDDGEYSPPSHVWEVYPPKGSSFIGEFTSDCTRTADLPGIGMTVYCPVLKSGFGTGEVRSFTESGHLNVDMLSWSSGYEGAFYDNRKPESVLMSMLERDQIASLETAVWILKSLMNAKEIHPENVSFKMR